VLPINRPENVVTVVNRYGYIYNVVRGSLKDHGDFVTFEITVRGNWNEPASVSILREEIGTVVENPEWN